MSWQRTLRAILTSLVATAAIGASSVGAQQTRAVGPTPPRLSFVDGEVSYWRPGAEDWAPAQVNTALAAGDAIYTANGANAELEIGSRAYVRVGSGTELSVESLETGYLQLRVPLGHAAVDLRRLAEGQEVELDTPNGAFLIDDVGYYRFDVEEDSTRFATSRGGRARVIPAGGEEIELAVNEQVTLSGAETATVQRVAAASADAWDRWNYDRTADLGEAPRSAQYVGADVSGVDDLDRYGDWRPTPKYGNVWVPRGVAADWAPYSTGRWVWDGYYGWTWVDEASWGWAPYHYGRWCYVDNSYWGWAPGPIVHRPVYSPALVAFFGGPHVGVSVSIGTPFVSWVALGWGEPVIPWWGPSGFVGRPYWGGWGGPRYVNNTIIDNRTIINVNNINRYDNFGSRGAVIGIDGDRFGRGGRGDFLRVDADRARNLRPVRGELGIRPTRESLVAREGRGQRPPDRIRDRRVVATRAPQDPARLPRSAGIVRDDKRREATAPRIVSPRGDRGDRIRGNRDEAGRPMRRGTEQGSLERGRRNADDVTRPGRPGAERGRDVTERTRDLRGRDANERTRDGSPQPPSRFERGQERGRGQGRERDNAAVERSRTAPEPPSRGAPRERDRNGREIRESGRAPTPPRDQRGRGAERERSEARIPDARPERPDRGGEQQIERQQRAPEAPRQERQRDSGRSRLEREAARPQRQMEQPRMERQQRQQRMEQPRVERQQRQQRMEQPRAERREQPRVERREQPRMERQAQPRMERQAQPRKERQPQERVQRQEAPREERQPRGDGNERGGGKNRDRER